ncbi:MAG TPA: division plane positioning ATPase MipZ [Pseudolabrys sp.]|jgi:chromosome partitioning protein|nr:division plane positioning ATPase MipZ [Pseudolabrys sp.]
MSFEAAAGVRTAHIIVVGNEKGGSGKSTVAMHIAAALMKAGQRVATFDLDARQKSFTHYIENRRAWSQHIGLDLGIPNHFSLDEAEASSVQNGAAGSIALTAAIEAAAQACNFIVIDTPGHDGSIARLAHTMADTLVTPLNDSFVDFDVLGTVNAETFAVTGASHYAEMVQEARAKRANEGRRPTDWIVLRNRLSMTASRNKRFVGEAIQELAQRLGFRCVDGLAERVVFREFYPRGLTAVDDLNLSTLGTRPTMSHATARMEMKALLDAMALPLATPANDEAPAENRDAA